MNSKSAVGKNITYNVWWLGEVAEPNIELKNKT